MQAPWPSARVLWHCLPLLIKRDEVFCSGFKIMPCTAGVSILSQASEHLFCCFPSQKLQAVALQENFKTSGSPGMGRLKRVGVYSEKKILMRLRGTSEVPFMGRGFTRCWLMLLFSS